MTKRQLWLRLLSENDTALASAIHLCERYITIDQLNNGKEFLDLKIAQLDEEVPDDLVKQVFPNG